MRRLDNEIVFITGASSGIGEACAHEFAALGAKLILCARRQERLQQITNALTKKFHTQCHTITLDIQKADAVQQAISQLPPSWQEISILVNNAGCASGLNKLYESDYQDFDVMIDTNIKGLLYVSRAIIPGMVQRQHGHILNIGSIAGHEVYPNGAVYCATKHAVNAINKGLKMDLIGTPIRVSSIDPGMVHTEFSRVRFHGDNPRADAVYDNMTPLNPKDIADACVYCATRPAHVNISDMVILPTDQASTTIIHRHK